MTTSSTDPIAPGSRLRLSAANWPRCIASAAPASSRAARGQRRERAHDADNHRARPVRQQPGELPPGCQGARAAQPAGHERQQESADHGLRQRRRGLRRPARDRQRPGEQGVGHRQGHRRVADVAQPAHSPGADHPAARPPQQRARQQHEAERQHADPARAAQREADVMPDQPERRGGAQHAGQPDAVVRRRDPADQHEQREHGEPAPGRERRGDRAGDHQRTRARRRGRPGVAGRLARWAGANGGSRSAGTQAHRHAGTPRPEARERAAPARATLRPRALAGLHELADQARRSRSGCGRRGRRPSPGLPSSPGRYRPSPR